MNYKFHKFENSWLVLGPNKYLMGAWLETIKNIIKDIDMNASFEQGEDLNSVKQLQEVRNKWKEQILNESNILVS